MVRRKNEGSFGCEAVARVLGQPNVPECGRGFLYLLSLCSKNSFMFLSVVWSFYNERQRPRLWARAVCGRIRCRTATRRMRAQNPLSARQPACEHRYYD